MVLFTSDGPTNSSAINISSKPSALRGYLLCLALPIQSAVLIFHTITRYVILIKNCKSTSKENITVSSNAMVS